MYILVDANLRMIEPGVVHSSLADAFVAEAKHPGSFVAGVMLGANGRPDLDRLRIRAAFWEAFGWL